MLQLKAFHLTRGKVKTIDFHPVKPILVLTDKEETVEVWNYETGRQMMCFQPAELDTSILAEYQLQRLAEKLPQYYGPQLPKGAEKDIQKSQTGFGQVRTALFLDEDTYFWQVEKFRDLRNGNGDKFVLTLPTVDAPEVIKGRRFLVVLCESKLVLLDTDSRKRRDAPAKQFFDGATLTTMSFLFRTSQANVLHIAVGCSDGTVRLFNPATWRVDLILTPHEKRAVTCLLTIPGSVERLIAGYADGQLCQWDPNPALGRAPPPMPPPSQPGASPRPLFNAPMQLDCVSTFQAHKGPVMAMTIGNGQWDASGRAPSPIVISTGKDNTTATWEAMIPAGSYAPPPSAGGGGGGGKDRPMTPRMRELSRFQALYKNPIVGVCHAPAAQSHTLLGVPTTPMIVGLGGGLTADLFRRSVAAAGEKQSRKDFAGSPIISDLRPHVPAGEKKQPKTYCIAAHPLRAGPLVAVGLNTGFVLLHGDRMEMAPAVAPLPKTVNSATLQGLALFSMRGGELLLSTHALNPPSHQAAQPLVHGAGPENTYTMTERWGSALQQPLGIPGRSEITVCPTGRALGLVWPDQGYHKVLVDVAGGGTPRYEKVEEGRGLSVAWRTVDRDSPSQYAVLGRRQMVIPKETQEVKKKGFFSRSKSSPKDAGPTETIFEAPSLQIFQIQPGSGELISVGESVRLSSMGIEAVKVYSGPLLGLVYYKTGTSAYGVGDAGPGGPPGGGMRMLRFLSWQELAPLSPEIPDPDVLSWDPMCAFCLMARKTRVDIYAARSAFTLIASLPIMGVSSCFWHSRQAYVTTPTGVHVIFVSLPSSSKAKALFPSSKDKKKRKEAFVQVIQLASFEPTRATALATPVLVQDSPPDPNASIMDDGASPRQNPAASAGTTSIRFLDVSGNSLPPCQVLPPGALRAVGVREGGLMLADRNGECHVVWLQHAGLRTRTQAAAGNLKGAIDIAASEMDMGAHDDIAKFLAAMYGPMGAREALRLPGVTPAVEAELALDCGDLDRAMGAVNCLAGGGGKPRGEMRRLTSNTSTDRDQLGDSMTSSLAPAGESGGLMDIFKEGEKKASRDRKAFTSIIDWEADLAVQRFNSANITGAADSVDNKNSAPTAGPRRTVDMQLAGIALRLAEASVLAKKTRYVSACARLAVTCRELSREDQLRAVLCLAKSKLTYDLKHVAMLCTQRRDEKVALLAATLSADQDLISETLASFGMSAERALHARAWKPDVLQESLSAWRDATPLVQDVVNGILKDVGLSTAGSAGAQKGELEKMLGY